MIVNASRSITTLSLMTLYGALNLNAGAGTGTDKPRGATAAETTQAFTVPHPSTVLPHTVSIEGATVDATVAGEMSVAALIDPGSRVRVVTPCECRSAGTAPDMRRVMTYTAPEHEPVGIVHFVDVAWRINAPGADQCSATIRFVDLDNGGSEDVETGTSSSASNGTIRVGLGPGRYALFLVNVYARSSVGYHENHPIENHEAYLEHGTLGIVTVGDPLCGGQVTMLTGDARVTSSSDTDAGVLGVVSTTHFGTVVHVGDVITTGAHSFLEITLPDKSIIRMAPNSRMQFESLFCEPLSQKFNGRLFFGNIWSRISTVLGGEGKFRESTGSNSADARGTIFTLDVDSIRTIYRVYPEAGKTSYLIVRGAGGDSVVVHALEESVIIENRPPGRPTSFDPERIDQWWESFDTVRTLMSIEWASPESDDN